MEHITPLILGGKRNNEKEKDEVFYCCIIHAIELMHMLTVSFSALTFIYEEKIISFGKNLNIHFLPNIVSIDDCSLLQ